MKILLVTRGSQGDVYPYLVIASELKRRGHEVTLNIPRIFEKHAESLQLDYILQDADDIEGMVNEAGEKSQRVNHILKWIRRVIDDQFKQLIPLVEQCDVFVCTNTEFAAPSIAEYCRKPFIRTAYAPLIPSDKIPPPVIPAKTSAIITPRLLWIMLNLGANVMTKSALNRHRERLGMPLIKSVTEHAPATAYNYLLCSRFLGEVDPDWKYKWGISGYCFNDTLPYDEDAYRKTMAFIKKDDRPVVFFSLGSCSAKGSESFCEKLSKACRQTNCKLVINSGWSDMGKTLRQEEHVLLSKGVIPHKDVFPACSAIIHHGGSGTTHRVANSGVPQAITPIMIDQFYWANRTFQLGVGPGAIKMSKVSEKNLEQIVSDLVSNPVYKKNAAALKANVRSEEQSVKTACDYIEQLGK
jgi:UDP:flavonoid glycosyltransferase YjiC (YdhE family)